MSGVKAIRQGPARVRRGRLAALAAALLGLVLAAAPEAVGAAGAKVIELPAHSGGGLPLMEALVRRHSTRDLSDRALPRQVLADVLWAAYGVNRPQSGGRTAPSARNWQEITVYAAMADGLYRYDARRHALVRVSDTDVRALTGVQHFVARAPLNLVYAADYARMLHASDEDRATSAAAAAGAIAQNVYLYCASQGLGTVVRGSIDRERLAKAMGLGPEQHIVLAQTVGYPKE